MSSTDNSILFSNLSLSLSSFECATTCGLAFSLSLSLSSSQKKKAPPLPSFPLFSRRRLLGSDKVSRKSPREEEEDNDAQRGRCVFLCWSSRNLSIMVFKREKKREGLQRRSVLIGEEIQLGFRVFFGLGFYLWCVVFLSLFCFCCLLFLCCVCCCVATH